MQRATKQAAPRRPAPRRGKDISRSYGPLNERKNGGGGKRSRRDLNFRIIGKKACCSSTFIQRRFALLVWRSWVRSSCCLARASLAGSAPENSVAEKAKKPLLCKRVFSPSSFHSSVLSNAAAVFADTVAGSNTNLPFITQQPQSLTVTQGQTVMFTVTATGESPLSYQWLFNSALIENATNLSLVISNVMETFAGSYAVIVSNGVGSVRSGDAILALAPLDPPLIHCPGNISVPWNGSNGTPVVFTATATATDCCHSNLSIICIPPSGSLFARGSTAVFCTCHGQFGLEQLLRFSRQCRGLARRHRPASAGQFELWPCRVFDVFPHAGGGGLRGGIHN